jgi:hypothetical protein
MKGIKNTAPNRREIAIGKEKRAPVTKEGR